MTTDKVQVAVRVRPVNRREIELGTTCVIDMDNNQTVLYHPQNSPLDTYGHMVGGGGEQDHGTRKSPKSFAFDHCFWSMDKDNPKFASQAVVFHNLGDPLLEGAFKGYNGCIFAYGQTGSGKSYTMMGTMEERGIIPMLCDSLFDRIEKLEDESTNFKVEVSFMEIYNEKVHDLLDLKGHKHNLKVREHNILGPYVDGLSTLVVTSFEDIFNLMNEGNKSRTVAATNMNSESSRSHAVFNIIVTQTLVDLKTCVSGEKVSKLSLVDLAGSERAQKTGAIGDRLREGSNINKSLTTLGLVISALADQMKSKNKFVPYRDSVLTWLLKDNLGGNSRTVMIATISPAADNYEETLSTLRYADRAKRIVNHAVVNEDPNARIIRELREEVEVLQKELKEAQSMQAPDLKEKLEESEKLLRDMRKTWEEKLAETEKIQLERHKALEEMGVSVETSGIKVQQSRYFLVNLNADPSLNELLVYYLKEHTLVGCPNEETKPDIQLSGLGIQPDHCLVEIKENEVFVTPRDGARTCVNGSFITQQTKVKHGDRILWGNNHFFRINTPIQNSPSANSPDADQTIDYKFAQNELMMKEFSNDPISEAICAVEQQYEQDKQVALEQQRQMYERQMQQLRYQLMSPGTPSMPFPPMDMTKLTPTGVQSGIQGKYQQWALERDKLFKHSLSLLREEVVKANALVREANFLADEMGKHTEFHVTLQIPASNLSPNRRRGAFVCEPAILVKRKHRGSQVWAMDKFENKIIDMRDMYEERKSQGVPLRVDDLDEYELLEGHAQKSDPFYEAYESHNLIGVANVFLACLFYDVKLDYHVPIISQQGEVAGKLHVEISKLGGEMMDRYADINYDSDSDEGGVSVGTPVIIRVKILEAKGLPKDLSNFVFCQYTFWDHAEPISVPPYIDPTLNQENNKRSVKFYHEMDFKVFMSDDFKEYASEGALSIEVMGHKVGGFGSHNSQVDVIARSNSLIDRWQEVTRKIELWIEIHEVNDQGEYTAVEVKPQTDVTSAGVFQLRQGHARRILARVKPQADSGTLPLICDSITSLDIGCICTRSKLQNGLDSYQEQDLVILQEHWNEALSRRHSYLDNQIQSLMNKKDKSETDSDRERALIDQWVLLTEERNAVLVPAAGSGIPGAPADWEAPPDMEKHRPVLFLDLNSDDMTTPNAKEGIAAAGINSILPKEQSGTYLVLPIVKAYTDKDSVVAVASWDSYLHESPYLNRITGPNDRIYLILKAVLRLSHPAYMEIVLRKRICVNVKHRNMSLTDKLKKKMWLGGESSLHASGITFDVVSNIPKASEDLEHMESLAQLAASQNEVSAADGETYIEKYIKGVAAVESILTLDRLRQEVAVKELLVQKGKCLYKTTSVPNIHQLLTTPPRLNEQVLTFQKRFDSIQDLSFQESSLRSSSISPARPSFLDLKLPTLNVNLKNSFSTHSSKLGLKSLQPLIEELQQREQKPLLDKDDRESPVRRQQPFETCLQHTQQHTCQAVNNNTTDVNQNMQPISSISSKLELFETKQDLLSLKDDLKKFKMSLIDSEPSSTCSDEFQDFESYESQQNSKQLEVETHTGSAKVSEIPHSGTCDSITEGPSKGYTPSMTSSGYGSQAVSTLTLSSEDSLSLRSMEDFDFHKLTKMSALKHGDSIESDDDESSPGECHSSAINLSEKHSQVKDAVNDINGNGQDLQRSSSSETLENFNIEKVQEGSMNLEGIDLKHAEDTNKISIESEFLDDDDSGDTESVKDNCLHISEEDLSVERDEQGENYQKYVLKSTHLINEFELEKPHFKNVHAATLIKDDSLKCAITKHEESLKFEHSINKAVGLISKEERLSSRSIEDDSESSSNTSRAFQNADITDPYSLEALEELDNLEDEFLDLSLVNESDHDVLSKRDLISDIPEIKVLADVGVNDSFTKGALNLSPGNQSTPKQDEKKMSSMMSDAKQQPPSCIDTSGDNLLSMKNKDTYTRNSLDLSDEHLSEDTMSSFGSRADLDRLSEVPLPSWIQVGESVLVSTSKSQTKMTGVVQFVGNVQFARGPWVGVELDLPEGKHNGSVNGIMYFKCRPRHGLFVRHDRLILDKKHSASRKSAAGMANRKSVGASSGTSPSSKSHIGTAKKKLP